MGTVAASPPAVPAIAQILCFDSERSLPQHEPTFSGARSGGVVLNHHHVLHLRDAIQGLAG
jgi:hypothetical protein